MNIKPQPNHGLYLKALQRMKPEQRLLKALELSKMAKELFLIGLTKDFRIRLKLRLRKFI
jgi:hypothetical protein